MQDLTRHAEMNHEVAAIIQTHHDVLAESLDGLYRSTFEVVAEILGVLVAPHRAPVGHVHHLDLLGDHLAGQHATHGLNFRKFRHRSIPPMPLSRR